MLLLQWHARGHYIKMTPGEKQVQDPLSYPVRPKKQVFLLPCCTKNYFVKVLTAQDFFFHISQPRTWVLNTNPKRISIVYFDERFGFNKDFFLLCRFSGFRCFTYDWIYSCWYFTQEKSLQRMHGTISHQCRISRIQKSTGPQLSLKTCFWIIKRLWLWHQITNLELLIIGFFFVYFDFWFSRKSFLSKK